MEKVRQAAMLASMLAGDVVSDLHAGTARYTLRHERAQTEDEKQAALAAAEAKRERRAARNRKNAPK